MRKIIITLLLAICGTGLFAQADKEVKYHHISLESKDDVPLDYRYYVERVFDGRQFRGNIGTVQKGPFNNKVLAKFDKPFEQELKDYLMKVLPVRDSSMAISLRINDLYISELTEAISETGYASVVADIIVNKEGRDFIVATVSANVEGGGLDVTGKHDDRIKQALIKCIAKFEIIPEEEMLQMPFDAAAPMEKTVMGMPAKGVYVSYTDMLKNAPRDDSEFYLSEENGKFYIINKYTGSKAEDYYAYSDGEAVYLNVSKYARDKYYAKTEMIGNKYFIEDVIYNPNNAIAMGAMFGVLGAIVFSSVGDATVPMMIDSNSGQPIFLSNAEIRTMLSPYPELWKEYKKSNRKTQDIKGALKKYYTMNSGK